MNYYFNTLKKDQKNEEFSNESESKNKKKEKEIIIPKFPDLSNTKIEDDDFEMNSKDFLDNNRIMRNELLRTNLFQKKLNNDFIKEFYDSFNGDEKVEYIFQPKNEIKKENNNNFLFFESFNENIPKIINYAHISKPTNNDNSTKENVYDQIAKNLKKDLQGNDFYDSENSKKTPEFQKFQTKILPSNQHEELIKVLPKKTSIPSSGVALLNKYNNYDLPMKYDDKYTEVLLNLHNKNSESDINLEDWKFQEPFDENTDENLSKDLRKKLNDHLLLNKENTTKFTRIKKSNLFDHQPILDEMTSFKNTNSSIANQNSDRLKSSPIISIHIHESIQKDLKAKEKKNNQNNEEFKFLEDYRLESVKNKRTLIQNELTNKNSTTIGLSSIENTDNNSEKPMYVLNMEIISSNCLSPIIKENIINLLKSNSNYVISIIF